MIGSTLSHYNILAKLGEGGMGEVYLAEDTKLDRKVALKVLPAEFAGDPERLARFEREAKTVAALNHPNIVTIYSVESSEPVQGPGSKDESDSPSHFLTMELLEGETLDRHIPSGGLELPRLFELAIPIADALAEAHVQGITHRDLKPTNVMVSAKGGVKILDFGLAKSSEQHDGSEATTALTQDGLVVGTIRYMSPEQARGEPADHRSDVFSLGVLLFEMATGRRPFQGESSIELLSSVLKDDPPAVTEINSDLPNHLARVIRRSLQKDPESRYQTALEVRNELQELKREVDSGASSLMDGPAAGKKPRLGPSRWLWAVGAVLLLAAGGWLLRDDRRVEPEAPAPAEVLDELESLVENEEYPAAFAFARGFEPDLARDSRTLAAVERSTLRVAIRTDPGGAAVVVRPYSGQWPWVELGKTPLESVVVPRGPVRVRIVPQDSEPHERLVTFRGDVDWTLPASPPTGMTWVADGEAAADSLSASLPNDPVALQGFFVDRFEVSNEQYLEFVKDGGYRRPELWPPFERSGASVSWQAAMEELVDTTGRPGPADWELGAFPDGEEALPVTGVSWFEAAAYAEWAGKELPTIYHWLRTAELGASPQIVPASNFGSELLPVGDDRGLGAWGTRDLAGNAIEWSRSETSNGKRLLLGGSWNQPSYNYFSSYDERPPWERRPEFGFRCIRETDGSVQAALRPIEIRPRRDFLTETPVDDATFEIYRSFHDFERRPLDPRPEPLPPTPASEHWAAERVSIDAGYGVERLPVMLFTPVSADPPYQTAVLFGGANAFNAISSEQVSELVSFDAVDFLIRDGRAVAMPIFLGTYERHNDLDGRIEDPIVGRDHTLAWSKEVRRTVDYLESRDDVDPTRIFYVGSSMGAIVAPVFLSLEPRFRAAYLRLGGLLAWETKPEVDAINFAPRVRVPILMINGRYDRLLPLETSQKTMLRWLGTPAEDKKLVLFDMGHGLPRPRSRYMREVLAWTDQVLGPVEN